MNSIAKGVAIAAVVAGLVACQKAPPPAAKTADASAAPAGPHVKPGLWEFKISAGDGGPAANMRTCADAANSTPFMGPAQCSQAHRTLGADGAWAISATCDEGKAGVLTLSGQLKGDTNSAYKVTLQTTISGAATAQMNGSQAMTIDAKWLADACPVDLKPGAIETDQAIIDGSGMKAAKKP